MIYASLVVFQCEGNRRIVTFFVSQSIYQISGTLIKLDGTKGMYGVHAARMDDPPRQPGYVILITICEADGSRTALTSVIRSVPVDNEDDEWDDRDWVQDVLQRLEDENILSEGGADLAWRTVLPYLEAA